MSYHPPGPVGVLKNRYSCRLQGQIQLEKKEDMKSRGLASPDLGDCLAMSFGVKVMARPKPKAELIYAFPGSHSTNWMRN
jgi:hypothetical protein